MIDNEIYHTLMRWALKRHARKGKRWVVNKYFTTLGGDHWRFHCIIKDKAGKKKPLYLKKASDTKIRRHIKIKSDATPFNPLYKDYFAEREQERIRRRSTSNLAHYAGRKIIQPC